MDMEVRWIQSGQRLASRPRVRGRGAGIGLFSRGDCSPGELYMGVNKTRHEEGQKMVFPAKQCSEEIINIPVIPEAAA